MLNHEVKITPVPPEILAQVTDLVNQIESLLQPYLQALTPEERRVIPKMADKSVAFVTKSLEFADSNPQFAPTYLDVESLGSNVQTVTELTQIENPLTSLSMQLSDTIMLAGSEAYVAALMYYNSVKEAARRNVPGAKAIVDDLKIRFEQAKRAKQQPVNRETQQV